MHRFAAPFRIALLYRVLAGLAASGPGWLAAQTAPAPSSAPAPTSAPSRPSLPYELEADRLQGKAGDTVQADGPVTLKQGSLMLEADRLQLNVGSKQVHAQGHVALSRDGDRFTGDELVLHTEEYTGFFLNTAFRIARTQAGGTAERVDFLGNNRLTASRASYSSCTREDGDQTLPWELTSRRLRVDMDANEGVAEGAVLRFYGVPIFAAPVMTFPVTEERKSGWLPPQVSLASNSGFDIAAPFYWNIAPNADMTLTPTQSSRRGSGLETEGRYLMPSHSGEARYYLLPSDQLYDGRQRWALRLKERASWNNNLFFDGQLLRVSDDRYWKDSLRNAENLTPRLLPGQAMLEQRQNLRLGAVEMDQSLYARVQRWQSLQDVDAANRFVAPYRREPQIGARWRGIGSTLDWSMQTEFNRFTHEDLSRVRGDRAHATGYVAQTIGHDGWRLTPKVSFNSASYRFDTPLATGETSASRFVPTFSLDNQWTLERQTVLFGRQITQTLEPRVMYLRTPYRDQLRLPTFDSAPLDFNDISVFSDNSFSGADRIADANQLTVGTTTRFIDREDGAEMARLGIAQRYLFSSQRITWDGVPSTQRWSDVLLFGSTRAVPRWFFDTAVQYTPETQRVARNITTVRYSPGPFRTLYTSYRMQRGVSELASFGWQWPLMGPAPTLESAPSVDAVRAGQEARAARAALPAGRDCRGTLYGVGRVDYSMRDQRWSNALVGVEYDAGCWIGRVVVERQSTGVNAATTKLMLQLELVGLSRIGQNPLVKLRDNIPGYQLLYDRKAGNTVPGMSSSDGSLSDVSPRP